MSLINKKKLNSFRKKIDYLDDDLLKIIKKRSIIVNNVLKLKNKKSEIVDKKRISFILKKIKLKSIQKSIDPKITNKIWKSIIWSFIEFERRNFKKK